MRLRRNPVEVTELNFIPNNVRISADLRTATALGRTTVVADPKLPSRQSKRREVVTQSGSRHGRKHLFDYEHIVPCGRVNLAHAGVFTACGFRRGRSGGCGHPVPRPAVSARRLSLRYAGWYEPAKRLHAI